jgi:hypothetical protein
MNDKFCMWCGGRLPGSPVQYCIWCGADFLRPAPQLVQAARHAEKLSAVPVAPRIPLKAGLVVFMAFALVGGLWVFLFGWNSRALSQSARAAGQTAKSQADHSVVSPQTPSTAAATIQLGQAGRSHVAYDPSEVLKPYWLLEDPYACKGRVLRLDVHSYPVISQGDQWNPPSVVDWHTTQSSAALRFRKMLSDDEGIFAVHVSRFQYSPYGIPSPDRIVTDGEIVVRSDILRPSQISVDQRMWVVECLGSLEGTNAVGAPIAVPLLRFLGYEEQIPAATVVAPHPTRPQALCSAGLALVPGEVRAADLVRDPYLYKGKMVRLIDWASHLIYQRAFNENVDLFDVTDEEYDHVGQILFRLPGAGVDIGRALLVEVQGTVPATNSLGGRLELPMGRFCGYAQ